MMAVGRLRRVEPRLQRASAAPAPYLPTTTDPFYLSIAWRRLVAALIVERGRQCERCGAQSRDERPLLLIGDHIVERRDGGPDLDPGNIMLLCKACHSRKTADAAKRRRYTIGG